MAKAGSGPANLGSTSTFSSPLHLVQFTSHLAMANSPPSDQHVLHEHFLITKKILANARTFGRNLQQSDFKLIGNLCGVIATLSERVPDQANVDPRQVRRLTEDISSFIDTRTKRTRVQRILLWPKDSLTRRSLTVNMRKCNIYVSPEFKDSSDIDRLLSLLDEKEKVDGSADVSKTSSTGPQLLPETELPKTPSNRVVVSECNLPQSEKLKTQPMFGSEKPSTSQQQHCQGSASPRKPLDNRPTSPNSQLSSRESKKRARSTSDASRTAEDVKISKRRYQVSPHDQKRSGDTSTTRGRSTSPKRRFSYSSSPSRKELREHSRLATYHDERAKEARQKSRSIDRENTSCPVELGKKFDERKYSKTYRERSRSPSRARDTYGNIDAEVQRYFHELPFCDQDDRSQLLLVLRPSVRLDKSGEQLDKLCLSPGFPITKTDSGTSNEDEDTLCFTPGLPRSSLKAITDLSRK